MQSLSTFLHYSFPHFALALFFSFFTLLSSGRGCIGVCVICLSSSFFSFGLRREEKREEDDEEDMIVGDDE